MTEQVDLLNIQEAAEYLRISETTLFKLMKEKKIRVVRLNRRTLFKRSTLNDYINSQETSKENNNGE